MSHRHWPIIAVNGIGWELLRRVLAKLPDWCSDGGGRESLATCGVGARARESRATLLLAAPQQE
jgi:hypothetical protein